jgi:hypothetical protein
VHDAAEHVAAELIDPERVCEAHAGQRRPGSHLGITVGDQEGAERRREEMVEQDHRADPEAGRGLAP